MAETTPPAGWYEDVEVPGGQRFWNGHAWTDDRRSSVGGTVTATRPRFELEVRPALFSPSQVGGAAFFVGPIAGVAMLAMNLLDLDMGRKARNVVLWGTGLFLAVLAIVWFVPGIPIYALHGAFLFGFRYWTSRLENGIIQEHFVAGGPKRSMGMVFLISIAAAVGHLVIVFGLGALIDPATWRYLF